MGQVDKLIHRLLICKRLRTDDRFFRFARYRQLWFWSLYMQGKTGEEWPKFLAFTEDGVHSHVEIARRMGFPEIHLIYRYAP